jgi:hypothetical protein
MKEPTMKPLKRLLAIGLILLLTPSLLFAQKNLSDWANVEKLKSGTKVTVSTKKGREFTGEMRRSTDDSLFVEVGLPVHGTRIISLAREEIAQVRIWKSRVVLQILGAAIGMGAGIAIGSAFDHPFSDDPGLAKLLGGGLGGLAGAAVGGRIPRKSKRVYLAP